MIGLPAQPRAAHLRAFWFSICTLGGMVAALFLVLFDVPNALFISGLAGVFLLVPGLAMPNRIRIFYSTWNRASRLVSREVSRILTGICFYVVFAVVALAGARFARKVPKPVISGWQRRRPRESVNKQQRLNWVDTYVLWARQSGSFWALMLLPFLSFLSVVAKVEDEAPPAHVYTLF
jgi:hypothetical protein